MLELGRWGLNFEQVADIANLAPTSLPNAIRVILQPPADVRLSIGLRSGGQSYSLRIEEGWIAAARGEANNPNLILSGDPAGVLALLVAGEDAEGDIEVEGDRDALEELRAMIVLPERLREAALAEVALSPSR
jgi:hypothetical protein